ncbi:glutamate decarboxylase [Saprolegnia parasitica CBS 223.65]|uniref:Glutamate decarboxylase n=2 Tax=Saprolegnia parasitica (strain CBS 223.65) TaxID=695850 RepID=A0A067CVR1_SAPPC|nr:glutamate decarboxylase [Saprolegnia parasitica CBS 223.65]KDO34774.1 glutamate decarboxylase [Saprolegnia parasitica CBS 223.65]|eukprot:XP_012194441.1 glutamate decarboxylase [Saprolegnia parasitica CBS 223.65]
MIQDHNEADCPVYAHPACARDCPTDTFPEEAMPANVAYQLIFDELALDGNPSMNLASFVTTYMEPEAEQLMLAGLKKNYIDMDQYPQTAEIHNRCVAILSNLFNAPGVPTGTGCVGSSEAIMLAGLAMKRKWRDRRLAAGLPADKPNMVFGSNVQVCWHKMCKYFEIEPREADVSPDELVLTAERARGLIDENTIGICAILGSTFNGEFENVQAIHTMAEQLNEIHGWELGIHVDAASGGFIAPFLHPELVWDFRLPLVKSINVSGHKFGLVYAGMGWALWREPEDLPDDLVFHVNYLGGDQASFTLNFSKGASNVIAQYYNIVRLGRDGYREILLRTMHNAEYLRERLVATGHFAIVDKAHMPLVAFCLNEEEGSKPFTCFDIQDKLRSRGWIVPAYTCSKGAESLVIMRVVVKQNFTKSMADMLVKDIVKAIEFLEAHSQLVEVAKQVATSEDDEEARISIDAFVFALGHTLEHRKSGVQTQGVC